MVRLFEDTHIKAIADAIRTKLGGTAKYKTSEMAAAIGSIPTGGAVRVSTFEGVTYTATTNSGVFDGIPAENLVGVLLYALTPNTNVSGVGTGSPEYLGSMYIDLVNKSFTWDYGKYISAYNGYIISSTHHDSSRFASLVTEGNKITINTKSGYTMPTNGIKSSYRAIAIYSK